MMEERRKVEMIDVTTQIQIGIVSSIPTVGEVATIFKSIEPVAEPTELWTRH
jgi:hypothetical protein